MPVYDERMPFSERNKWGLTFSRISESAKSAWIYPRFPEALIEEVSGPKYAKVSFITWGMHGARFSEDKAATVIRYLYDHRGEKPELTMVEMQDFLDALLIFGYTVVSYNTTIERRPASSGPWEVLYRDIVVEWI